MIQSSPMIVEEKFRVNIYLDTNILVDYFEKNYPLLNTSINLLAKSQFVNLRSSHFVLFEYTEVRKANLFRKILVSNERLSVWKRLQTLLCRGKRKRFFNKAYIKQCRWCIGGEDYDTYASEITSQVEEEVSFIKEELNIDFDEHVLHSQLIAPTIKLCLGSKLSKEDCLVILSCVLPKEETRLSNCAILSRDKDMFRSFEEKRPEINQLFKNRGLTIPVLVKSTSVNGRVDLYSNSGVDLQECWNKVICGLIIQNNASDFIGRTYSYGATGPSAKCVYFMLNDRNAELKPMTELYFIAKDLSWVKHVKVDAPFWNKGKEVSLPHSNPDYPKYSFMPSGLLPEDLLRLREEGALVFYAYD